jgi:hypothetical protein
MEKNEMMHTMGVQEIEVINGGASTTLGELIGKLVGELVDAVVDQLKKSPTIV